MDYTLYIPDRIYSRNCSGDEAVVYTILNMICSGMSWSEKVYISSDMINYYLYGDCASRRNRSSTSAALSNLIAEKYICAENNTIYTNSVLKQEGEYFTTIPYSVFKNVITNGTPQLYLYLLQLLSTRDNKHKVSYQKIDYLEEITGLSRSTIMRYNKKLEDIGVLYIRRSCNLKKGADGESYSDNNVYGLACNKEAVDKYADEHSYSSDVRNSNWQRMVTAKYNAYIKNPDSCDGDELYKMCEEYNLLMDKLQEQHPGNEYIKKKKNLDVFLF